MENKTTKKSWSPNQTILNRAFTWASIAFLLITLIGVIAYYAMNKTQIGKEIKNHTIHEIYNYNHLSGSNLLTKLSLAAFGGIIISSILSIIWVFKVMTASKFFIYSVYFFYIIAQGLSFGFLFLTFQTSELFLIFGLAGGLFATMAIFGYFAKDLSGMGKYLIVGSIFLVLFGLVLFILSWIGILNAGAQFGISATLFDLYFFFLGIIFLGFIAFDVWRLKKMSQWAEANGMDKMMSFRLTAFFGFRLLSDFIALIWILARFVAKIR